MMTEEGWETAQPDAKERQDERDHWLDDYLADDTKFDSPYLLLAALDKYEGHTNIESLLVAGSRAGWLKGTRWEPAT